MKYLLIVCAAFMLLATGCGEPAITDVTAVDKAELTKVLDAHELTLVEFTAVW